MLVTTGPLEVGVLLGVLLFVVTVCVVVAVVVTSVATVSVEVDPGVLTVSELETLVGG